MKEIRHRLLMLKPMQAGVSGYARLECQRGSTLLQINIRGLKGGSVRAFWYCSGGETRELGQTAVNARGEAALTAEAPGDRAAPERLQALLLLDGAEEPRPLMIGLCASQSAGSLLDAKNASLSLCQRLAREARRQAEEARPKERSRYGDESNGQSAEVRHRSGRAGGGDEASAARIPSIMDGIAGNNGANAAHIRALSSAPASCNNASVPSPCNNANTPAPYDSATAPQVTQAPQPPSAPPPPAGAPAAGRGPRPSNSPAPGEPPVSPEPKKRPERLSFSPIPWPDDPPREIFLPAIDPLPYVEALLADSPGLEEAAPVLEGSAGPVPTMPLQAGEAGDAPRFRQPAGNAVPVTALEPLRWPAAFASLQGYFDRLLPCAVFDLPGWRFVCASREGDGLWLGYLARDGAVRQVIYAMRGEPPRDDPRPYQLRRGLDGATYRVLAQRAG